MPLPPNEPTIPQAVHDRVEKQTRAADRFRHVFEASVEHRNLHGCDVYPSPDAPLLGNSSCAVSGGSRPISTLGTLSASGVDRISPCNEVFSADGVRLSPPRLLGECRRLQELRRISIRS